MDLFADPAGVAHLVRPRPSFSTLPEVFSVRQITTGSSSLTMPTHFAPTAGLASLLIGVTMNNITDIAGAAPPMPTGADWTSLVSGQAAGATHHEGLHIFAKLATSAAESFGTAGTGTQRCGCISIDIWPAPVSVTSLFNVAGATVSQSGSTSDTTCAWPGLTIAGTRSRVVCSMVTGQINSTGNHVPRSDLNAVTYAKFTSGVGGVGVSGEVSSWPSTNTTLGASSRDYGIAIEVYHPGDI